MLSAHCPYRNLMALMLFVGVLAGCRSERAAFQFQPQIQEIPIADIKPLLDSKPPSESITDSSITSSTKSIITPPRRQTLPTVAKLRTGRLLIRELRPTQRRITHAPSTRQQRPTGSFDLIPLLLLLGVIGLAFLIIKFPLVTLIVLGALVITALVILIWLTSGHWAFG